VATLLITVLPVALPVALRGQKSCFIFTVYKVTFFRN